MNVIKMTYNYNWVIQLERGSAVLKSFKQFILLYVKHFGVSVTGFSAVGSLTVFDMMAKNNIWCRSRNGEKSLDHQVCFHKFTSLFWDIS